MKKIENGFTLVELLGVLVILGIILTITIYSVNSILDNSEESLTETQKSQVVQAARVFYLKEGLSLEDSDDYLPNKKVCVTTEYLVDHDYLDRDVISPETNDDIGGYVLITDSNNKYLYEYKSGTPSGCVQPGNA